MDLILDCTTLFDEPVQTGIQRTVRRLIHHWPATGPRLHVARFHPEHGLVRISDAAVAILLQSRSVPFGEDTRRARRRLEQNSPPQQAPLPDGAPVLLAEIFFDPARIGFYRAALRDGSRVVAMLAYDFLVYTHTPIIDTPSVVPLMGYLRLMTKATRIAFISEQTRTEFATRIVRRPGNPAAAGPVFQLGADGLPTTRQAWNPARRGFTCVGTINRRKNQHLVAEAFQSLRAEGVDVELLLVGHDMSEVMPRWLIDMLSQPGFSWWNAVSDTEAGTALDTARATIFASELEGFGLPPIESLHAGVPVIAPGTIPSLQSLAGRGHFELPAATVPHLRAAMTALLDDTVAARLWHDTATLALPGWADFASAVATWCDGFRDLHREPQAVAGFSRPPPAPGA